MIRLISGWLGKAAGGWLASAALPLSLIALLTVAGNLFKARDEAKQDAERKLIERGRQQCISDVELSIAKAEVAAAQRRAAAAEAEAQNATRISAEIQANADSIQAELAQVRSTVSSADAARCLSDGVLDLVRNRGGQQSGGTQGASASGARKDGGGSGPRPAGKTP